MGHSQTITIAAPPARVWALLVDMEGYSVEEAAQILGCAPGMVKRCFRGRARLLPLLSHLQQTDADS